MKRQHEPLRIPEKWQGQDRALVGQIERILDDIYNMLGNPNISGKADKVKGAKNGNLAGLDADGNLVDSGKASADLMSKDAVIDLIYPVGSIYMSVASVSPATLFDGTTWEQLKDVFLLGAGDTYTAGDTGGAASVSYTPAGTNSGGAVDSHTLTTDEIPSHNHSFTGTAVTSGGISANHTHKGTSGNPSANHTHTGPSHSHTVGPLAHSKVENTSGAGTNCYFPYNGSDTWGSKAAGTGATGTVSAWHTHTTTTGNQSAGHTHSVTAAGSIGNKGGGQGHSHGFTQPTFTGTAANIPTMPPYIVVNVWKRTA